MKKIGSLALCLICTLTFTACEADKVANPKPSDIETFNIDDQGAIGSDDAGGIVADTGEAVSYTPLPPGEETADGVILNVRPTEDLPEKIKVCASDNFAGEVANGEFQCNNQALVDCGSELSEPQKAATLKYANEKLRTYTLWGCSLDEAQDLSVHFYTIEGQSLKIFNLAVKKAGGEAEAAALMQ